MIAASRSGPKTVTASDNEPSEARLQLTSFWPFCSSLARCRLRSDTTTGWNRYSRKGVLD